MGNPVPRFLRRLFSLVGTAPPRWLNPSDKNVSANAEMFARKKNTFAIGRHNTRARSSRDNRINFEYQYLCILNHVEKMSQLSLSKSFDKRTLSHLRMYFKK